MSKYSSASEYQHFIRKAIPSDLYPNAYNLRLVTSIDELNSLLSQPCQFLAFDTETNGLDPEINDIVGYSFCMDGKNAYYVAVNHKAGNSNLGLEALDLIYNKMVTVSNQKDGKQHAVLMFNMRFDTRMMEYTGYDSSNYDAQFYRYDMSKVTTWDIQAMVYLADTNKKYPSLKWSEEWFLGWRGASFEDTLGAADNFEYLDPNSCYTYAATDALGTYLLLSKVGCFFIEAKTSGQLDIQSLFPLMRYEEELTCIDVNLLKTYAQSVDQEIDDIQNECYAIVGFPFNLGSPKEKSQIFDRMGISTGARNSRNEWKSSEDDIIQALETIPDTSPSYRLLSNLIKFNKLRKLKTSYIDNIIQMCDNPQHPNKLRFSYKTTEVPSGRLAAGGDKKNPYFAALNIQNIPKPHVTMWYYVTIQQLQQHAPQFLSGYNPTDPNQREFHYTHDNTTYTLTVILDFVFSDHPFNVPDMQEYTIEGFIQDRNIRSAFMPDPDRYWVSIDFSAEELRVPTLLTKEPVWLKVFSEGGDVHKSTAYALWGKENYTKDLRKLAKGANFGILYGQNEYNFAHHFDGDIDKARDFLNTYKTTLSTLFRWVAAHQAQAKKNGMVTTMFGRPIRLRSYFNSDQYSKVSYAKRFCVNATIQGTGADILKIAFLKLWSNIWSNPSNRQVVKFLNTIHDEINYNVSKDKARQVIPILIRCMRLQLPTWEFPMEVGLSIGNRWGLSFDFNFDTTTFEVTTPKGDPYNPDNKPHIVAPTKQTYADKATEIEYDLPTIDF